MRILAFLFFAASSTIVQAQGYPNKPIRWIVPRRRA